MRTSFALAGLAACLAGSAFAGCAAGQEPFTSCQIAGRGTEVFVCSDDQVATYSYGPIGAPPELVLSTPVTQVDFAPWPGLGRAIFESVTFYNGDFSYEVGGGFERPFSEEEMAQGPRRFGWVAVARNGQPLVRLECVPDTVTYGYGDGGIYGAMTDAGLVWDEASQTWVTGAPAPAPALRKDMDLPQGDDCLPASEFALGEVALGDPLSALGKLGSPEASGDFGPDGHGLDRMTVVGLEIDIHADTVFALHTTDAQWAMPSGLRVGLTRGEVIRILGYPPNGAAADEQILSAPVCHDAQGSDDDRYVVFFFGQDKRVESIMMESFYP